MLINLAANNHVEPLRLIAIYDGQRELEKFFTLAPWFLLNARKVSHLRSNGATRHGEIVP